MHVLIPSDNAIHCECGWYFGLRREADDPVRWRGYEEHRVLSEVGASEEVTKFGHPSRLMTPSWIEEAVKSFLT